VLITYPSSAEALAQLQEEGALHLALREVWVGGEQLSPARRAHVAQAFGCAVRNNYGASECFSIAWECSRGQLHLNDDWVIAQPVDASNRPVPPGEWSDAVLLTNLANRVQPLIRYRLDDRMRVLPQRCACGSAFTAIEVSGRSGDTLSLPDARRRPVAIVPLALETAIEEDAGLTRFQVIDHVRRGVHTLEVRFEEAMDDPHAAYARCHAAIDRYLAAQGVARTRCVFGAAPPQRDAASGKLRRVRRA
jgi:phenylacetate-coenzyme A ligase PaaK-like adenylate-forming protein